jgi:hypothetical protein
MLLGVDLDGVSQSETPFLPCVPVRPIRQQMSTSFPSVCPGSKGHDVECEALRSKRRVVKLGRKMLNLIRDVRIACGLVEELSPCAWGTHESDEVRVVFSAPCIPSLGLGSLTNIWWLYSSSGTVSLLAPCFGYEALALNHVPARRLRRDERSPIGVRQSTLLCHPAMCSGKQRFEMRRRRLRLSRVVARITC